MTRQQRLRHQKGLDRADMNNGKLEKKVKDSLSRAKTIKARAVCSRRPLKVLCTK